MDLSKETALKYINERKETDEKTIDERYPEKMYVIMHDGSAYA